MSKELLGAALVFLSVALAATLTAMGAGLWRDRKRFLHVDDSEGER